MVETVVIVGSGLVGKSWAMLFTAEGHEVRLYDKIPEVLAGAPQFIKDKFKELESKGQLKNHKFSADQQCKLIKGYSDLAEALTGATYIQECTPETLEMKTKTFAELEVVLKAVKNTKAVIGSSTSTIVPSKFVSGLSIADRMMVVHPVNPPYFVRLVELIPNPSTRPEVITYIRALMTSLGQKPIVMNQELPGFALNRIQYAILNECWNLVSSGVLTVEDADMVMKEGLAPRYMFMGPLETAHLNAEGFVDYCNRYGQGIYDVSLTMRDIPTMTGESAKVIDDQLQQMVPQDKLPERRVWRDENLANLASFKSKLGL